MKYTLKPRRGRKRQVYVDGRQVGFVVYERRWRYTAVNKDDSESGPHRTIRRTVAALVEYEKQQEAQMSTGLPTLDVEWRKVMWSAPSRSNPKSCPAVEGRVRGTAGMLAEYVEISPKRDHRTREQYVHLRFLPEDAEAFEEAGVVTVDGYELTNVRYTYVPGDEFDVDGDPNMDGMVKMAFVKLQIEDPFVQAAAAAAEAWVDPTPDPRSEEERQLIEQFKKDHSHDSRGPRAMRRLVDYANRTWPAKRASIYGSQSVLNLIVDMPSRPPAVENATREGVALNCIDLEVEVKGKTTIERLGTIPRGKKVKPATFVTDGELTQYLEYGQPSLEVRVRAAPRWRAMYAMPIPGQEERGDVLGAAGESEHGEFCDWSGWYTVDFTAGTHLKVFDSGDNPQYDTRFEQQEF